MLASALTTEVIGIHALFGAFLAGAVMPRSDAVRQYLTVRIEDFTTVFLLPLFFVSTGLRTSITLLNDAEAGRFAWRLWPSPRSGNWEAA
jgi:Kef-type K+ transport system membrane component KefB